MKPAPFEYLCPETTAAALAMLAETNGESRILAGGQSLVPMLNFRIARFKYLIDVNSIAELCYIRGNDEDLRIGAVTRYRTIENSPLVASRAPLLAEVTKWVGHLPIRTRGTIGGSLAHADPAGEYAAALLALDAEVVLQTMTATRVLKIADFIRGMFTTALEPDEMLVEIRIPCAKRSQFFAFDEYARRPGDLAIMGIAVRLDIEDNIVDSARIVALGCENGARRIIEAEESLVGHACNTDQIEKAARAAGNVPAHSDIHATAALRKHLAVVLSRRALTKAMASGHVR